MSWFCVYVGRPLSIGQLYRPARRDRLAEQRGTGDRSRHQPQPPLPGDFADVFIDITSMNHIYF